MVLIVICYLHSIKPLELEDISTVFLLLNLNHHQCFTQTEWNI